MPELKPVPSKIFNDMANPRGMLNRKKAEYNIMKNTLPICAHT